MRTVGLWVFGLTIAGWICACGGPPNPISTRPSLLEGLRVAAAYESPARWQYHPRQPREFTRSYQLAGGSRLILAAGGERWLVKPGQKYADVAGALAPETLVAAVQLSPESWLFVGSSGATYESREPLGRFLRSGAPPTPLVKVSATRRAVFGVTRQGRLLRTTDAGATWQELPVEGRVADVAILEDGHGLALVTPEKLLKTSDFGAHFVAIQEVPFGAVGLKGGADSIDVLSFYRSKTWTKAGFRAGNPRTRAQPGLGASVRMGPNSSALNDGLASFTSDNYLELTSARSGGFRLWAGPERGPMVERSLKFLADCAQARIAALGDVVYVACATDPSRVAPTLFFRSSDGGKEFEREPYGSRADFRQLRLAVTRNGGLVVAGVCPRRLTGKGCLPAGIHRRELRVDKEADGPPVAGLHPATVPALRQLPLGVTTSFQGELVFAVGTRTKGDQLVVFVSDDGGKSFRSSEVSEVSLSSRSFRVVRSERQVESMRAGADGHVAIVLYDTDSRERTLLVVDEQGEVAALAQPPMPRALVSAAGLLALAFVPNSRDIWESTDGGLSWEAAGTAPVAACAPGQGNCKASLHCYARGCVFNDRFSRVGWRGQSDDEGALLPPLAPAAKALRRRVRPVIGCTYLPNSKWTILRSQRFPSASQAAIGATSWFAFDVDYNQASVAMHEALFGKGAKVKTSSLFSKARAPADTALYASLQIEGIAALRQERGKGVQIAWKNLFESTQTLRATLPAEVDVGATAASRFQARVANPGLLSIAAGGIFMRPARAKAPTPTYFLDGQRTERLAPAKWPESRAGSRGEMVRAGGKNLWVRLLAGGAGVVRAQRFGSEWQTDAMAAGLLDPKPFRLRQVSDIAYVDGRAGLHLMFLDGNPSQAWLFPFAASGPVFGEPLAVPNQSDLAELPRSCSTASRLGTPRVVAPYEAGTRHPVVVTHSAEPIRTLLTNEAVLHGTVNKPCAAVFDATPVERSGEEALRALIYMSAEEPSWLFRRVTSDELSYRPMSCAFDPKSEVPEEVYAAPGTSR